MNEGELETFSQRARCEYNVFEGILSYFEDHPGASYNALQIANVVGLKTISRRKV